MKLSLAFAKEDNEKNNLEINSLKELRNYFKECIIDDYKFNFVKQKSKNSQKSETDRIYLIPFIFEYQLSQFNGSEEDSFIIKMTSNLYGLLLDNTNKSFITTKDIFINQDPIEIESIYLGTPQSDSVILPTCPVCIKRLDKSISGLNLINCRDLFHSCCRENCRKLSQNCAVCCLLYYETRTMDCRDCGSTENLWICLICGNLGCGRYKGGHAHNHFLKTGHSFAVKSDSHHIWDYTLDKYVHWNIKSAEGTVVDVNEDLKATNNSDGISTNANEPAFMNDFTAAQLESQKAFFEQRLQIIKREKEQEISILKLAKDEEIRIAKEECARSNHERKILTDLANKLQDHLKKLKQEACDLKKELETEKKITKGLCESIDDLETDLNNTKMEKEDLVEQVKDLMKHLEVIDLVGKAGNDPDIVEGKLLIRPNKKKNK